VSNQTGNVSTFFPCTSYFSPSAPSGYPPPPPWPFFFMSCNCFCLHSLLALQLVCPFLLDQKKKKKIHKKKELMAAFGTTSSIFLYVPVRRIWSVSVFCLYFFLYCTICHMRNAMSSSFALTVKLHVSYPSVCPCCPLNHPPAHTFDTSSALHFPPTSFIPLLQKHRP